MDRRAFLENMAMLSVTAALGCQAGPQKSTPNIVLIVVDDLGWKDLGCYGSTYYETPNIDRLAASGVRFTNAYSACPVCSPTRAALLTGKSPAKVGFTGHITAIGRHRYPENGRIIPPQDRMYVPLEEVTIAEALKPAGYKTISIGKWHAGNEEKYYPDRQGFDRNIAGYMHGSPPAYFYPYKDPGKDWNPEIPTLEGGREGEYLTDRLTDEAIEFIEESKPGPFFLYLPYYAVHTPLQAPHELIQKYREKTDRTDSPQGDPVYGAMVERMDFNVGRIMASLEGAGLQENTLFILVSDNGGLSSVTSNQPLREGKGYLYEGGIRVPLIISRPGHIKAGVECHAPTISHDLYPTITDFVGGSEPGEGIEGQSLAAVLKDQGEIEHRELYWYYPHYSPQAQQPSAAVRDGDYKLIHFYDPVKSELYDLAADPGEQDDLAEKMPEKSDEMLQKLEQWLERTGTIRHTLNPDYNKDFER